MYRRLQTEPSASIKFHPFCGCHRDIFFTICHVTQPCIRPTNHDNPLWVTSPVIVALLDILVVGLNVIPVWTDRRLSPGFRHSVNSLLWTMVLINLTLISIGPTRTASGPNVRYSIMTVLGILRFIRKPRQMGPCSRTVLAGEGSLDVCSLKLMLSFSLLFFWMHGVTVRLRWPDSGRI